MQNTTTSEMTVFRYFHLFPCIIATISFSQSYKFLPKWLHILENRPLWWVDEKFEITTKEDEILHRWFLGKMVCEWRGRMIHVMIFQEGVAMLVAVGNEATLQSL